MSRLARFIVWISLGFAEQLAGRLLREAGRKRMDRLGPDDAHETRHLFAAILAGNSDPCDGATDCHLDRPTLVALHDATFPDRPFIDPLPVAGRAGGTDG